MIDNVSLPQPGDPYPHLATPKLADALVFDPEAEHLRQRDLREQERRRWEVAKAIFVKLMTSYDSGDVDVQQLASLAVCSADELVRQFEGKKPDMNVACTTPKLAEVSPTVVWSDKPIVRGS